MISKPDIQLVFIGMISISFYEAMAIYTSWELGLSSSFTKLEQK